MIMSSKDYGMTGTPPLDLSLLKSKFNLLHI